MIKIPFTEDFNIKEYEKQISFISSTITGYKIQNRTLIVDFDDSCDADELEQMIKNYAAGQDLTDPQISPLFGDYEGFPPTYIQVGSNEILQDDAALLYKKLLKDNVSVKMDVFKGMWHVFQMSPFKTAYEAMDKNAEFIYDICR